MTGEIDWVRHLSHITKSTVPPLRWGLPEPWIQVELFGRICEEDGKSWLALQNEVPYATRLPVHRPKHRDIARRGAVKWADLCLVSDELEMFCWLELKVRHAGVEEYSEAAAKSALSALKRDIAALWGMDRSLTYDAWTSPDEYTKAHWFPDVLGPHSEKIARFNHSMVVIYLQLNGVASSPWLSHRKIIEQTRKWIEGRMKLDHLQLELPAPEESWLRPATIGPENEHSAIIVTWQQD
jgi:hypothetical protein